MVARPIRTRQIDGGRWIAWRYGGANQGYSDAATEIDAIRSLADQERDSFAGVLVALEAKLKPEPSWHVADSLALIRAALRQMDTEFPHSEANAH